MYWARAHPFMPVIRSVPSYGQKWCPGSMRVRKRILRQVCLYDRGPLGDVFQWAEKKWRTRGQVQFSKSELMPTVERVLQSRRAFLPDAHPGSIRAMTINQAKNREFEGVMILWPFAVGGDLESQRRRLYNALTRAKKWAIVIVQDAPNETSRLAVPPFSKPPKSSS